MPLDDNEQKILAEIERQFYEEDPELARAVQRVERPRRFGVKLSILGVMIGAVIIAFTYANTPFVAAGGFVLVVVSATSLVNSLRDGGWSEDEPDLFEEIDE